MVLLCILQQSLHISRNDCYVICQALFQIQQNPIRVNMWQPEWKTSLRKDENKWVYNKRNKDHDFLTLA